MARSPSGGTDFSYFLRPQPSIYKMCQCCRSNGSGRCNNCSCVKAGISCTDCLQSKRMVFSNQPNLLLQTLPTGYPPPSHLTISTRTLPPPSPDNQDTEETQPLEPELCPLLVPTTEDVCPSKVSNLPDFKHMASPEFTR